MEIGTGAIPRPWRRRVVAGPSIDKSTASLRLSLTLNIGWFEYFQRKLAVSFGCLENEIVNKDLTLCAARHE